MMPLEAQKIVDFYGMSRIPHEGPWFLQTHLSDDRVAGDIAKRYPGPRSLYSSIVAVMTRTDFSEMHRLATDEMWHFYGGMASEILLLYPNGEGDLRVFGGSVLEGQEPQLLVPRGTWMGARPIGGEAETYTFFGNTLSPGFEYEDYQAGDRDELVGSYPNFEEKIRELTRQDS
ncbi:MAG: cupin domain-containing protein [Gammaproteobacteria bacterium]|jgi:uncharacterized protein|nr:cupin domain-containing protein [Gammaproteobacteria bacterium]MBT7369308.1 cupin domain-containing protein [Gammaproteobacteria bacterium]